jgi:hypothetical protein
MFNLLAWVSLVLCIITACVIVRGFFRDDMVEHFTYGPTVGPVLHRSRIRILIGRGILYVLLMDETETTTGPADMAKYRDGFEGPPDWSYGAYPPSWPTPADHQRFGFGYSDYSIVNPNGWATPRSRDVRVPLWLPLLLLGVLPAGRFKVWWKLRWRLARGACGNCGYDLRASPDRCPECGLISTKAE